ncbi:hypothetical protein RJ55_02506 [Drechmeria coniospora]|nr:hypothetical protein RJ55_02506 [Drechmeria coniospora]
MKFATTYSYAVAILVGLATASPLADPSVARRSVLTASDFQDERVLLVGCLEDSCQPDGPAAFSNWATSLVSRIEGKADLDKALKECKRGCVRGVLSGIGPQSGTDEFFEKEENEQS